MTDWSRLDAALERRAPTLWWRDDDAVAETPALHRLMDLADAVGAPLTLAVIPGCLKDSLPPAIEGRNVTTAIHGWTHTNHAPGGEKSAEFGAHRPTATLLGEAARGKAVLDTAFDAQSLPVFIPPWNRIADGLPLADIGYEGLSVFGQREITTSATISDRISRPRRRPGTPQSDDMASQHIETPGLRRGRSEIVRHSPDAGTLTRFDAHIDPINWRGDRSAVPAQHIVDHITDLLTSNAPIGLMTHHLVHDDAIWTLVDTLVRHLTRRGARWISASDLLAFTTG